MAEVSMSAIAALGVVFASVLLPNLRAQTVPPKSVEDVKTNAQEMLGRVLVTHQTGAKGKQVNRLYIEEGSDIDKEFYLSILVNRETSEVSFVVSTEGGVNIEDVAHNTPEKIVTFSVDPATGIMPHHGRTVAKALALSGSLAKQAERE